METLRRIALSRAQMMKRVARFKDLKGFDGGLPDSKMPGCERTLYNVIGFQPPKGEGGAVTSPVGDDAARLAAIKISEGFNLGYCRAKPGRLLPGQTGLRPDDAQSFLGPNTAEQITAPRPAALGISLTIVPCSALYRSAG